MSNDQKQYDAIIIGAGHNGLICATYLAKAGKKVLVLEASNALGGLASTREFHKGYKATVAHTVNQFSTKISRDLQLEKHGYKVSKAIPTIGLDAEGEHVTLINGSVSGVGEEDVVAFNKYLKMMQTYAAVLKPFSLKTIPRIGNNSLSELFTFAKMGLKMRLLGKKDMRELLRVISLPARDLMDENFDSPLLKAMLSWDGLIGSKMAPRSPNHTVLTMLYRMIGEHGGDHSVPDGGIEGLVSALSKAATSAGVVIRTNAAVKEIVVEGNESGLQATGVVLLDGEKLEADKIVSAVDPKRTFIDLVGVNNLEIGFTSRISRLRSEGLVAKLHLALDDLPTFKGIDRPDGRMIIAPEMDSIEFAFDDSKYGEASENPVLEIVIPSLHDASVSPVGKHVLSAHVMYVPHDRKGGWTKKAKADLTERVISTIEQYAPDIRKLILHKEMLTPEDIAKEFRVTGGHWHHGEFALDQMMMMRPTYEAGQYSTPIPGLYLASAGSHPGGGLMGGPGHNAAKEVLK